VARGWVALLRGVNLGRRNKVPMAELRDVFEAAGAEAVRTYIQSGNVLFEHAKPDAAKLERAIANAFGVESTVVLRSFADIRRLAGAHPFGKDISNSFVAFLAKKPTKARVTALGELDAGRDRFELVRNDVVLRFPAGYQSATLTGAVLERELGVPATVRNWRTVAKLDELSRAAGPSSRSRSPARRSGGASGGRRAGRRGGG
jgi:uncharacterized protein (DUF1697 family)